MSMRMGVFRIECEIVNPRQPRRSARVRQLLVDSGSEFTWVPGDVLDRIGIRMVKKDQQFVMANGQTVTRSVGYAIIRATEFETIDEVVFAQPGDLSLLGSRTLEGFGAHVDARNKRLVAAGPHLAAGPPRR
jgi:predicted aspartyl protease